jgi:hypothetical protein
MLILIRWECFCKSHVHTKGIFLAN